MIWIWLWLYVAGAALEIELLHARGTLIGWGLVQGCCVALGDVGRFSCGCSTG